jgi:hypothetical protein
MTLQIGQKLAKQVCHTDAVSPASHGCLAYIYIYIIFIHPERSRFAVLPCVAQDVYIYIYIYMEVRYIYAGSAECTCVAQDPTRLQAWHLSCVAHVSSTAHCLLSYTAHVSSIACHPCTWLSSDTCVHH